MNKQLLAVASLVVATSTALILAPVKANADQTKLSRTEVIVSDNLIENGDFSHGFDCWDPTGSEYELLENEDGKYVELFGYNCVSINQSLEIDPNSVYEVSYLGYGDTSYFYGNGSLQLNKWTSTGGAADTEHVHVDLNNEWTKYSTLVNSGEKKYSSIQLQFCAQGFQGLKFTDVAVRKIG